MIALASEAWAQKLIGKSREEIALVLCAAFNAGLQHARETCSEMERECKSAQQIALLRDVSTQCLHMQVCDGDTMEPVDFPDYLKPST